MTPPPPPAGALVYKFKVPNTVAHFQKFVKRTPEVRSITA